MYSKVSVNIHRNKLAVIPAHTKRKGPFLRNWQEYSDRIPSIQEIQSWNKNYPNANTTIVLGKASGIIGIDIDFKDDNHVQKILDFLPNSPIRKKGKKGLTAFYKYSGEETERLRWGNEVVLEILSDGTNTVIPPSIHPETQKPYTYLTEMTLETINRGELTILPETSIRKIREYINLLPDRESVETLSDEKKTSRNEKMKSIVAAKINNNDNLERIVKDILLFDLANHFPPLFGDKSESICRADEYSNALAFVSNILSSINKKRIKAGEDPIAPDYMEPPVDVTNNSIKFIKLGDLLNEPEEQCSYLIEDLLPNGGSSLLFAKPKAGKSTIARNMALSIAQGKMILGRKVDSGSVLYLAIEEKRSELAKHFRLMGATGKEDIYIKTGGVQNSTPKNLKEVIQRYSPKLVIIDTLNAFIKINDGNDYAKTLNILLPYIDIARELNTHIMFVHHSRKNDESPFDSILGSTAILASIDTAINLKRDENKNYIQTRQRYGDDLDKHVIHLNEENKIFSLGPKAINESQSRIKNQIIEYLETCNEAVTNDMIKDNVEGKSITINKQLNKLVKDEVIESFGAGKKGEPRKYKMKKNDLPPF